MSIDLKKQPTSWVHAANHTLFDLELTLHSQLTIPLFTNRIVSFPVLYICVGCTSLMWRGKCNKILATGLGGVREGAGCKTSGNFLFLCLLVRP